MSKITIVTGVIYSEREKEYGWAYRISKGRRQYQCAGVFSDAGSIAEVEVRVFRMMCSFLHENVNFEEDTKITVISECREVIRLMRSGDILEIGELRNNPTVMAMIQELIKYRETQARCIYKFISYDKKDKLNQDLMALAEKALKDNIKKDGAKENCSARR